jgi:hypothetical protein
VWAASPEPDGDDDVLATAAAGARELAEQNEAVVKIYLCDGSGGSFASLSGNL